MDFPSQQSTDRHDASPIELGRFDMRDGLMPRRLTLAMWDNAFLMRHIPGGAFEHYDRVIDQAIERGYNTLRLDPMPQWIDLARPDDVLHWPDPELPYMPWNQNAEVRGPVGRWLIEFVETLNKRRPDVSYVLSAWWFWNNPNGTFRTGPPLRHRPTTHRQAAEVWSAFLDQWRSRFGLDGLVFVDIANEIPHFLPEYAETVAKHTGDGWSLPRFTPEQIAFLDDDINGAIGMLQRAHPDIRFTGSIHGDLRWLDVPLHFDCLDVHFYADADPRWVHRTRFRDHQPNLYTDASWHADFSNACVRTHRAIGPMLRARQRGKLAQFAHWAQRLGMPLTTSESWASWFYFDSPDLDWSWLLEWAEWSVEDAVEFGMWGWTPHNYVQPQFRNWGDVAWHRRLTERFLKG